MPLSMGMANLARLAAGAQSLVHLFATGKPPIPLRRSPMLGPQIQGSHVGIWDFQCPIKTPKRHLTGANKTIHLTLACTTLEIT